MSKMKALAALVLVPAAVALSACGSDSSSEQDARVVSAKKAWGSTQSTLEKVGSAIVAKSAERLAQVGGGGTQTFTCTGGGSAVMVDNTTIDLGNLTAVTFEWDATFDNCVEDGETINGSVTYKGEISVDGQTTSVKLDYTGDAQYAGEFEDDCSVDIHTAVTSSATSNSVSITGTFCGIAADEVAVYNEAAING